MNTRVLVLSAHDTSLDRRIVAEANSLVAAGAQVTLLSVPVELEGAGLDRAARTVVPVRHPVAEQHRLLKRLLRGISPRLYERARSARYAAGRGPADPLRSFFVEHAPAGPFDVIHCHDLPTLPAGASLRERWPAARLIYDSHELFPCQFTDRGVERYWREIEDRHIRAADAVITVNPSIADEMARTYGIATPTVIYNSYGVTRGTPIDDAGFAAHFGLAGAGLLVLYQGGLVAERNLENLVRAFAELRGTARLLLLGDGPLRPALHAIRIEHQLDNVFFGRWVSQDTLLAFTERADLGIIPYPAGANLNTRYCTPNKLFEFIEAGLPICASDLPELKRIVAEGGIGGVYVMETPSQIATAVRDCIARARGGEFSSARRAAAREAFSWRYQAETLKRLYDTVVAAAPRIPGINRPAHSL